MWEHAGQKTERVPARAAVLTAILGPMAPPLAPQTGVCGPGAARRLIPWAEGLLFAPSPRSRAERPERWCRAGVLGLSAFLARTPHLPQGFRAWPAVEWIPNGLARTVSPSAAAKGRKGPSSVDFPVTLNRFHWFALGTEVGITGLAQMPIRSRRRNIDGKSQPHPLPSQDQRPRMPPEETQCLTSSWEHAPREQQPPPPRPSPPPGGAGKGAQGRPNGSFCF